MFSLDLWEISGHAAKYKDDMFLLDVEKQVRELVVVRVCFSRHSNCAARLADIRPQANELPRPLRDVPRASALISRAAHALCRLRRAAPE